MRKSFKIALFSAATLFTAACNNLLDFKPPLNTPNELALGTADDLESAILGGYNSLQSTSMYGAALKIVPEALADHVRSNREALNSGQLSGYYDTFRRQLFAQGDGIWREGYAAINRANNIIDAIENNKVTRKDNIYEGNKNRILGEAYFIRAAAHFELVRLFGAQYGSPAAENDQSGIIIKTAASVDRNGVARSKTAEVYNQVLIDLRKSESLLKASEATELFWPESYTRHYRVGNWNGGARGRVNKLSAKAFRQKVFFQMGTQAGNDSTAALCADLIIELQGLGVVLDPLPNSRQAGALDRTPYAKKGYDAANETIFQIVNTADPINKVFNTTSATIINTYTNYSESQAFKPFFLTSEKYFEDCQYSDNNIANSDKRYDLFITQGPAVSGVNAGRNRYVQKYWYVEDPRIPGVGIINVQVMRAAELYLNRAEVLAYNGQDAEARNVINVVRQRAGLPNFTTESGNSLILAIRRERMRELAFEGDRVHNIRRMIAAQRNGIATGVSNTLLSNSTVVNRGTSSATSTAQDGNDRVVFDIDALSTQFLFPIPDAELFSNPLIKR